MQATGTVLFMRHPETVANVEYLLGGQANYPLTEAGEEQRKLAVEALVAWAPDRIICSSLERTQGIAKPAAQQLGVPCTVDDCILELYFGEFEGKTLEEIERLGYPYPWRLDENGRSIPCPGGEYLEEAVERARGFAEYVAGLEGKTACVTHGGFIRALFAAIYNLPVDLAFDHAVENVTSFIFKSDGKRLWLNSAGLRPKELIVRARDTWTPKGP